MKCVHIPKVLVFSLMLILFSYGAAAEAKENNRDPKWAKPVNLLHVKNFYQVAPGLYRSAQPSAKAFAELEKFGIVTVINLREAHSDEALILGTKLNLIEVKVNTWEMGDKEVIEVMKLLKDSPRPILVHCKHGADRTGMMMAVYRIIFEGWSRNDALKELTEGGYGYHKIWTNIPKYIKNFNRDKIERAVLSDG